MISEKVKHYLGIIIALGGAVAVILGAAGWIIRISGVPERLDGHVSAETTYHKVSDSTTKGAIGELHGHTTDLEKLMESLVRGECIENPKADLARQGLLAKCRQLGIQR